MTLLVDHHGLYKSREAEHDQLRNVISAQTQDGVYIQGPHTRDLYIGKGKYALRDITSVDGIAASGVDAVLSTCPLNTNSWRGKERRIFTDPW